MRQAWQLVRVVWRNRKFRAGAAVAIAVAMGIEAGRLFVGAVYVVEGSSMAPAYPPGVHLYGAPISTPLERGDVVLLDDRQGDYALKRIVGLPGETIHLWRGRVFINKQMLVEPYLPPHTYTYPTERARRGAVYELGGDEYFMLGDNRFMSADSRAYGPVKRSQIKQRVPPPQDFICGYFSPHTLPAYGRTTIRPTATSVRSADTSP